MHNGQTMAPTLRPAYRMRPLELGEILDEAFRIYRANFALLFGVALVASAPAILSAIGSGSGGTFGMFTRSFLTSQGGGTVTQPDTSLLWLTAVGVILSVVMFPISTAALTFAACSVALGMPATVGSILRDCLRNYWRVWGLGIIWVMLFVTMILVITIPFVILILVRWTLRYPVLYLEHAGVGGSMTRSSDLVKGSWWRVAGILIVAGIIVFVLVLVVGAMGGLLSLVVPAGLFRQSVSGVISALTSAVLVPFSALVTTLLYLDLRVRKESLDLQLMAGQVGEVAPSPPELPPAWGDPPPPLG